MKRRLFWKILLGFWATFFIIVQGIWLLFVLLRPVGQQPEYVRMARVAVTAAATIIRLRGEEAVKDELSSWPTELSPGLQITRATNEKDVNEPAPIAQAAATAPSGRQYRVAFYAQHSRRPPSLFNIPFEVLVVGGAGGLIFSLVLAWYLTKPIQDIRDGFANLAKGIFTTRLKAKVGRRRDEIADLARDFDNMAARLQELVAARDRLLADVSHELRTPLARLNLAVELARQDSSRSGASFDRISKEMLKLDDIVSELLVLVKLESSSERSEEYINLAELLNAVTEDSRYEARAKGVSITLCPEGDYAERQWLMPGNGKLIYRAIENIVRNAVRYSPEGGVVEITFKKLEGIFSVVIGDRGTGIREQDFPQLFKPFGISADGSGFGLGLAIAQRAVTVHGGAIYARNRIPRGLEMEVQLPAPA